MMEKPIDEQSLKSPKSYAVAVILSGIFGVLGIHHFYCGRHLHGMFDLSLSIGAFIALGFDYIFLAIGLFAIDAIHTIFVTFQLLVGNYRVGDGRIIAYPGQKL
jgi:TM2 domain-containing membrane protein YozV